MNKRLKLYIEFIDGLVNIKFDVLTNWVKQKGWPQVPENEDINSLLKKLSGPEKETLAKMMQQARDGGIHDTLVFLSEQVNLENLKLVKDDVAMAVEPYGTTMYWDWVARSEGDEWPEHQLDDEYK